MLPQTFLRADVAEKNFHGRKELGRSLEVKGRKENVALSHRPTHNADPHTYVDALHIKLGVSLEPSHWRSLSISFSLFAFSLR